MEEEEQQQQYLKEIHAFFEHHHLRNVKYKFYDRYLYPPCMALEVRGREVCWISVDLDYALDSGYTMRLTGFPLPGTRDSEVLTDGMTSYLDGSIRFDHVESLPLVMRLVRKYFVYDGWIPSISYLAAPNFLDETKVLDPDTLRAILREIRAFFQPHFSSIQYTIKFDGARTNLVMTTPDGIKRCSIIGTPTDETELGYIMQLKGPSYSGKHIEAEGGVHTIWTGNVVFDGVKSMDKALHLLRKFFIPPSAWNNNNNNTSSS
jgi:hypothetical protein